MHCGIWVYSQHGLLFLPSRSPKYHLLQLLVRVARASWSGLCYQQEISTLRIPMAKFEARHNSGTNDDIAKHI